MKENNPAWSLLFFQNVEMKFWVFLVDIIMDTIPNAFE